jgi:hypothetical protein
MTQALLIEYENCKTERSFFELGVTSKRFNILLGNTTKTRDLNREVEKIVAAIRQRLGDWNYLPDSEKNDVIFNNKFSSLSKQLTMLHVYKACLQVKLNGSCCSHQCRAQLADWGPIIFVVASLGYTILSDSMEDQAENPQSKSSTLAYASNGILVVGKILQKMFILDSAEKVVIIDDTIKMINHLFEDMQRFNKQYYRKELNTYAYKVVQNNQPTDQPAAVLPTSESPLNLAQRAQEAAQNTAQGFKRVFGRFFGGNKIVSGDENV